MYTVIRVQYFTALARDTKTLCLKSTTKLCKLPDYLTLHLATDALLQALVKENQEN